MNTFLTYLNTIQDPQHRAKMQEVLSWVMTAFPALSPEIAWNQPMFTHHDTYIIGFSAAKKHFAVAPERATMERFSDEIIQSGYAYTRQLIRVPWEHPVNFALLEKIIRFNMMDKADCKTFWRKADTAHL